MGRIIGYQYDDNVQDGDAWIGSEDGGGRTKQYTAEAVANYLNIQGKISIVGQMTYKYGITPLSGPGTFAVFGGGTDPVAFSAITKLTLSNTDVSKQRVVEFLNLLVGSDILISKQGAISTFGYYSIDNYAVNATDPAYYDLGVTFKSGNGSMEAEQIYETQNFTLAAEENISTLQTTIDAGNRYASGSSLWQWDPNQISQVDPGEGWGLVLSPEEGVIFTDGVGNSAGRSHLQATNLRIGNLTYTGSVFANNLTANRNFQLPNNSGTLALTTDITSSPWDTVTGGINYANGNVGIGTTNPSTNLEVVTSDPANGIKGTTNTGILWGNFINTNSNAFPVGKITLRYGATETVSIIARSNEMRLGSSQTQMSFYASSSEKMRIHSNGNVGIGTTNPLSPLHVASIASGPIARFINTSGTGGNGVAIQGGNGSGIILSLSDYSNIERLRVNGDGNVGIGTTAPGYNLHIADTDATINLAKTDGDQYLRLVGGSGTNSDVIAQRTLTLQALSGNVLLQPTGNVGIGTTSPSQKLEVNGNVLINGAAPYISIKTTQTGTPDWKIYNSYNTVGDFAIVGGSSVNNKFNIQPNGNVGIGTTSPAYKLDVTGSARIDGVLRVGTTAQNGEIKIIDSNGKTFSLNSGNVGNNKFAIEESGTNVRYLVIDGTTSNVGIGVTAPSQKLEVDGQVLSDGYRLAAMQTAPATRNSTGTLGEIVIDGNHIYVCYATDSWSRVALDTSW